MSSLGDHDLEPKPLAKRLGILLAVLVVGWMVALMLLSKHHPRPAAYVPEELPVYEGGYEVVRHYAEVADWEQVAYTVDLSYPSTAVYQFYRQTLDARGWKSRTPDKPPQWKTTGTGKKAQATFYAAWASPDQLQTIELTLVCPPHEDQASMRVDVRRSRAILPEEPEKGPR